MRSGTRTSMGVRNISSPKGTPAHSPKPHSYPAPPADPGSDPIPNPCPNNWQQRDFATEDHDQHPVRATLRHPYPKIIHNLTELKPTCQCDLRCIRAKFFRSSCAHSSSPLLHVMLSKERHHTADVHIARAHLDRSPNHPLDQCREAQPLDNKREDDNCVCCGKNGGLLRNLWYR